jgi:hypothetical protein
MGGGARGGAGVDLVSSWEQAMFDHASMRRGITPAAGALAAVLVCCAAGPVAAQNHLCFAPRVTHAVGPHPYGVAAGDFDHDGHMDLAVSNAGGTFYNDGNGFVTVLFRDAGGFAGEASYLLGTNPGWIGVADFNLDGHPDIAVINYPDYEVTILQNDGTGVFTPQGPFGVGPAPNQAAIGDFDRDGRPDLAVVNTGPNGVSVLRNTGAGFAERVFYPVAAGEPKSIDAGDLDGDGDIDLAVGVFISANSGAVLLLRNLGGNFDAPTLITNTTGAGSPAIADLDGDGNLDLAVTNYNPRGLGFVSILINGPPGQFVLRGTYTVGSLPTRPYIADLDRDGDADIVVSNYGSGSVSVLRNTGNAAFAGRVDYAIEGAAPTVALADFNGDLLPDIAAPGYYASYTVSLILSRTANWNRDGTTNSQDLFDYLNCFFGDCPPGRDADFNGDGVVNAQDFFAFLDAFFAGC